MDALERRRVVDGDRSRPRAGRGGRRVLGVVDADRALAEHGRGVRARPEGVLVVSRLAWRVVGRGDGRGVGRVRGVGAPAGRQRRRVERGCGAPLGAHREPDADGGRRLLRVPRAARQLARARAGGADARRPRRLQAVSARDRALSAARPGGAAARAAAAAAHAEPRAGGGGDRRAAAAARPVVVRAAGEHGDADRPGAEPAPRGRRLVGAADRDRAAPGEPRAGAQQGRRARLGAGAGRADPAVVGLPAQRVRRPRFGLRVREPVGGRARPPAQLRRGRQARQAHAPARRVSLHARTCCATRTRPWPTATGSRSR